MGGGLISVFHYTLEKFELDFHNDSKLALSDREISVKVGEKNDRFSMCSWQVKDFCMASPLQ